MPRKTTKKKVAKKSQHQFLVVTRDDDEEYGSACGYRIFSTQKQAEDAAKEERLEEDEYRKQYLICKVVATSQPPLPQDLEFNPV